MSYCRRSEQSDIYLYGDVGGYVCCCVCILDVYDGASAKLYTYSDAIAHVKEHIRVGHKVPDEVLEQLEADRADEGDDSPSRKEYRWCRPPTS